MTDQARDQAERLTDTRWFRTAARSGFAASGLVHALVGVLAIQVAVRGGGPQADQSGALESLSRAPGGAVLLWLVTIGSLALALWLVADGLLVRRRDAKQRWQERSRSWGRAVVYAVIGVTALRVAAGAAGAGGGSNRSSRQGSASVLGLPGGPVLLAVIALAVIAIGIALIVEGLRSRFVQTIRVPAGRAGRVVVLLGRIGYTARGVAVATVGVLLGVAAITVDPGKAGGLDGALRAFAGLPFGRVALVAIGVGWVASGVYSLCRARLARLD